MNKMIKNKGSFLSVLASVMMITACSSEGDMLSTDNNKLTGRVMYAIGAYNDGSNNQSRLSYNDDFATNYLKLAWSEDDAFSAFINGSTTKYNFAIQVPSSGIYTANETFKCDDFASEVADGTIIDAIYPAISTDGVNPVNIKLNLKEQTQDMNQSTTLLKNYDYMVGHATYSNTNPNELNFNFKDLGDGNSGRLASIYRIKVALASTITKVSKIVISCIDENYRPSLVTSEKVNFTNGSTSSIAYEKDTVTLNITNGVPSDGVFVGYVMLFPSAVKERTIAVTATDGGVEKIYADTKVYDDEVIYTRGQFKYINLDFSNNVDYKPNLRSEFEQNDFKIWSTENCEKAPSRKDIEKYIGAGVYWDEGTPGSNQQTYKVNGVTYHAGLWAMKMNYINQLNPAVTPSSFVSTYLGGLNIGRPSDIDKYFFLPAAGYYRAGFEKAGTNGYVWSSTPNGDAQAYGLGFSSTTVLVFTSARTDDFEYVPMVRE